jgi:AcrR family transcriptional regulator
MGRRSSHTPEQLRELIIEAATELIAENGLQGLSAREIARRIEYSPGTIYNVFRDIDELLFTIEHRMLDTLTARLASVADAGEPLERLCAMAATYLAFSLERPQLWNLLMEHTQKPGVELPPDFKCRLD